MAPNWQAYNRWPSQFSLYDDGKDKWYCGPDVDISFDRPYGKYCQIVRPRVYTEPLGPDPRAQRITTNILEKIKQHQMPGNIRSR